MNSRKLEDEVKNEVGMIFGRIKKHRKSENITEIKRRGYCNNFSSHCCLSCDKCWGNKKHSY